MKYQVKKTVTQQEFLTKRINNWIVENHFDRFPYNSFQIHNMGKD